MKLKPNELPRPRLLTSIEETSPPVSAVPDSNSAVPRRHRRALLLSTLAVLLLVLLAVYFFYGGGMTANEPQFVRRLISVATHTIASGSHPSRPPNPVVVEWNTDVVQVTGIALGHPRLAVINGKQVAEGEWITIRTPTRSVAVTLRVLRIADGQVQLSDGTQIIIARLIVPPSK